METATIYYAGQGSHFFAVFERPRDHIRGIDAPEAAGVGDAQPATSDWRAEPGSPANRRAIRADGEVVELEAGMLRHYPSDAHLVTYVVHKDGRPLARQPRVNKTAHGLAWIEAQGYAVRHYIVMADVDLHDPVTQAKTPWTPELLDVYRAKMRGNAMLKEAGFYLSKNGLKIFWTLARPVTPAEYEQITYVTLRDLQASGIEPDFQCNDWTRFFRLPRIVRDGAAFDGVPILPRVHLGGRPFERD